MKNTNIIKTAGTIDRILKAIQVIMKIGSILLLVGAICILFLKDTILANMEYLTTTISLGMVQFTLSNYEGVIRSPMALTCYIALSTLFFAILLVIALYALKLIRRILEPMKEGRPFDGVAEIIRKLAWVVLIGGIAEQVFDIIVGILELRAYDMVSLVNEAMVQKIQYNYVIDGSFVVVFAILFLLSYIFQYGEELQCESDETL